MVSWRAWPVGRAPRARSVGPSRHYPMTPTYPGGFVPQVAEVEGLADVVQAQPRQLFLGRGRQVSPCDQHAVLELGLRLYQLLHEQMVVRPRLGIDEDQIKGAGPHEVERMLRIARHLNRVP